MIKDKYQATRYASAVLLIISSIALAFSSLFRLDNVVSGVLMYIAQAFLLAGSIFGLDYYVHLMSRNNVNLNPTKQHNDSARTAQQ